MPYRNHGSGEQSADSAPDARVARLLARIGHGSAWAVIVLGAVVLLSWLVGARGVSSLLPGLATMKASTCLAFLAVGASCISRERFPRTARSLAIAALTLGTLSLVEITADVHLAFDELLVDDPSPERGRMSGATAFSFVLLGLASLFLGASSAAMHRMSDALAIAVSLVALLALLGYSYDVPALYEMSPFSSLSLPTALGFAAGSTAILFARSEGGASTLLSRQGPGAALARRLLPAMVLVPAVLGWLRFWAERRGHFAPGFGVAAMVATTIIALTALTVWTAVQVDRNDSARRLAELLAKRTEAQLYQAQKMEAVARLAGGVAHDFNNLLTVILSYSEFLSEDLEADDPKRHDVDEISKAGERARRLTSQLLLFSRHDVREPTDVDLNALVRDMENMISRIIRENVTVELLLDTEPSIVRADPGSVEQVVMNLAVNAGDAMPAGGRLTIETSSVELDATYTDEHFGAAPGSYVVLAVSDTGTGMDEATQERIFEPFFTTKERGKGTGLGLSTTFGIVRQTGGTIWVYSEVGRGTTFKVYLPRAVGEEPRANQLPDPIDLEGTETVLLAEDEDQVRKVLRSILEKQGYRVLTASSGAEALRVAAAHDDTIDLLVTDLVMPDTGGMALAADLLEVRAGLRVLYMSGYTDEVAVRFGLVGSAAAYVQKPVTPAGLARRVREVLDHRLSD